MSFTIASPGAAHPPFGDAIISNGTVQLGVHSLGHLNVAGGAPSSGSGTTVVGLRYVPTGAESTAPGCLCEGWGAADAISGMTGHANEDDGVVNLTPVSFASNATSAVSVVDIGTMLRVTHDYHPSSSPNLYEVAVSITNISAAAVDLRYRRVMDWDVEPTAFNEFVTIQGTAAATEVVFASNNGFASANPLAGPSNLGAVGDFVDAGPADHGALFDFAFGMLAPSATKSFKIYYGAAGTEAGALAALAAVGAEVYSFGQANVPNGPSQGVPNTFIFAFAGVGGVPVAQVCAVPDPLPPGTIIAAPGVVTVGTAGDDVIVGTGGDDRIVGQGGKDRIYGLGGNDKIAGGDDDDLLCGGDGNDELTGGPGADELVGEAGNDNLSGDIGADKLSGGTGIDTLAGGADTDVCTGGGQVGDTSAPAPSCDTINP